MVDHEIELEAKQQNVVVGKVIIGEVRENDECEFMLIRGDIYYNWYRKKRDLDKKKSLYRYNGLIQDQV